MITKRVRSRFMANVKSPFWTTQHSDAGTEQGLTLIECIVALVIIALTVGSVTPALVIAVATRVQSQKAEQAIEVAQAEIDTVRTIMERGNYDADSVPTVVPNLEDDPAAATDSIEDYPGPVSGASQPATTPYETLATDQVREVDVDGDNTPDFGIQVYRTPGQADNDGIPIAFTMGVRVYDIRAINAAGAAANLSTDEARVGTTGGEGERSRQPLAVVYTVVAKGDLSTSYCDYIEFLGSTPTDYPALGCT